MSKIEQQFMFFVGIAVLLLGSYVAAGWLLTIPFMVTTGSGQAAMVFNTALCFIMSGIWLTVKSTLGLDKESRLYYWLSLSSALVLMGLSGAVLIEMTGTYEWSIDWISRHTLIADHNRMPGRMTPNICVAFLCVGSAFLFDHISNFRIKKSAFIIFGSLTLFAGASSLIGYFTNLEWVYAFAQQNRLAVPTSIGLTLIGSTLIIAAQSRVYNIPTDNKGEDVRLIRIAALIMIALALASGFTSFIILKQGMDHILRTDLQQKAVNNADIFLAALERRYMLADKLFTFPMLAKDLQTLPLAPNDASSLAHIEKTGDILLDMGFSGLQIKDNAQKTVYTLGAMVENPDFWLPIKISNQDVSLLWNNGLVLHIERPIIKDGQVIGTTITEQPMAALDRTLHALQFSGKTTDAVLCHRDGSSYDCLPSRLTPHTIHTPMFINEQPAFPMARALLKQAGVIYADDVRGVSVLAAYTPIGDTGLGLVVKIDTTELYAFIREELHIFLGALALFVLMGISALRMRIQPLASRLVRSEQRMREANEVLEKAQLQLKHMAQYDALTGLPNRSLFMDRLSRATLRADRNKEPLGLMFLDMDGFKQINDTHGHLAGDILLKQFAERLAASVRKTDTVARLAGDEFTIILEALADPERDVQIIAAKIIQAMSQPFDVLGNSLTATTSIGIVIGTSDKIETDQLLHMADTEMYKAKKMGKNQFSLTSA